MGQSEKQQLWKKQHYQENKEFYINKQQKRRKEIKEFIDSFKTECDACYEYDKACLDFHHLDGADKDAAVSQALVNKWGNKRIITEIEKCVVLCSNCHRKLHAYNLTVEELKIRIA